MRTPKGKIAYILMDEMGLNVDKASDIADRIIKELNKK
jgi:hypothetical protein